MYINYRLVVVVLNIGNKIVILFIILFNLFVVRVVYSFCCLVYVCIKCKGCFFTEGAYVLAKKFIFSLFRDNLGNIAKKLLSYAGLPHLHLHS